MQRPAPLGAERLLGKPLSKVQKGAPSSSTHGGCRTPPHLPDAAGASQLSAAQRCRWRGARLPSALSCGTGY